MRYQISIIFIMAYALASCISASTEVPSETLPSPSPSHISTFPTQTTKVTNQTESENVILDYALSPDGDFLAIYLNSGIHFYNFATMDKSMFLEFEDSNYSSIYSGAIAYSQDGEKIAISGKFADMPIVIYDIESRDRLITVFDIPNGYFVTEIEFSPDGQSIIIRNTYPKSLRCGSTPEDKLILYNINKENTIFEQDECVIYPPINFRFSGKDKLFTYVGEMGPLHSVSLIDINTGQILFEEDRDWDQDGHFYSISSDGDINLIERVEDRKHVTYLVDSNSKKVLDVIEGKIVFFRDKDSYVVNNYGAGPWDFREDGESICTYSSIDLSPQVKVSTNHEIFAFIDHYSDIQVWDVTTCKLKYTLHYDN